MQRKQQALLVGKKKLTVWEANWSMTSLPEAIVKEAQALRASLNGSADRVKLGFHEVIYPWLASYSTGSVPTVDEAYKLSDSELDKWYDAIRKLNPDQFPENIPSPVKVEFSDGSNITVRSARMPSALRRLFELDEIAHVHMEKHPDELQEFARLKVYAKMACCSDVSPAYEELDDWPATELTKWYEAVLKLNPQLFLSSMELEQLELEEQAKKNSVHHSSSSS